MMDMFKRALQCTMAVVLVLGLTPLVAFADGEGSASEAENPLSGADFPEASVASATFDNVESAPSSTVGLSVGWNDPVCETPTVFTVQAPGATAQRQYRLDSFDRYQSNRQYIEWVMDPSKFVYQDSPEFEVTFFASGLYRLRFSVLDKGVTPVTYESIDVWVTIDDPAHPSPEAIADRVAAECLAAGNDTDFDKALWLHDWVIDNMEYDGTLRFCGAEGAFARGIGTCESYHRAYVMLLQRVGIPTGRITGNGHVWTAVKMDGEWYQVDATWDDTAQYAGYPDLRHMYFGLNDSIMGLVHSDHAAPVVGYESNSLENNYFIKTGDIIDWSDPIANVILDKLNKKETSFTVKATNAGWAQKDFKDVINNLVAYELNQYEWTTDNQTADAVVHVSYADDYFTVNVFTVLPAEPKIVQNLVYNGNAQTGVAIPTTGSYASRGTTSAVDAGTYTARVAPGEGYAWNKTGDRTERVYQWKISPASISSVSVTGVAPTYEYTGSAIRPRVTVKHGSRTLQEGKDYRLSYGNNVQAGTATVTVQGMGKNYTGSKAISFTIAAPKSQWVTSGGKKYYYGPNGQPVKWSQKIGGSWYYFNGSGAMHTGWITWADGTKSYFGQDGRAATGWRSLGGVKYYFNPSTGISVRWLQKIDGRWYYFNGSNALQTGWIAWGDGTRSLFGGNGAAISGWQNSGGRTYYLDPASGASVRWSRKIGSYWYYFDSQSRMATGLVSWADGTKSYYDSKGRETAGWGWESGAWYYFEPMTGRSVRWSKKIGGSWYYFNGASRMVTGWVSWGDGTKSYFDPGTGRAFTGSRWIAGKWYYFDPVTAKTR